MRTQLLQVRRGTVGAENASGAVAGAGNVDGADVSSTFGSTWKDPGMSIDGLLAVRGRGAMRSVVLLTG